MTIENTPLKPTRLLILIRIFAFCLAIIGAMMAVQMLVFTVIIGITRLSPDEFMRIIGTKEGIYFLGITQIFTLAVTLTVVSLFRERIDRRSFHSLGWSFEGRLPDALFGLFMGFGLMAFGFGILSLLGYLEVASIQFQPLKILFYFFLCAIISINEELIVRGYLLNNLMRISNKYVALLISSLLFALMHAMSPNLTAIGFVNIILAGVLLGIYYVHQLNLWFPIALHFSWNFFQGPIFGFEVSGIVLDGVITQKMKEGNDWLTGGDFGFEGSILVSILMVLSIAVVHFKYRKKERILNLENSNVGKL